MYRLYGDRKETINHMISEYCKLAKRSIRHNFVENVNHWKLCMMFRFDQTNK